MSSAGALSRVPASNRSPNPQKDPQTHKRTLKPTWYSLKWKAHERQREVAEHPRVTHSQGVTLLLHRR